MQKSNVKRKARTSIAVRVPIPVRTKHPFSTMEIDHAFVVPSSRENSIRSAASRAGKKLGKQFTVRRLTEKEAEFFEVKGPDWVGVWRVS